MKPLFVVLIGSAVAALLALQPRKPDAPPWTPEPPPSCVGGCAAVPADGTALSRNQTHELVQALTAMPAGTDCPELEELLFQGTPVDASGLSPEWRAFLDRELSRKTVILSLRIGTPPRVELTRTLPIGPRTHLRADRAVGVTPPEVTLTVKRVGLDHLWTRI